MKSRDFVWGFLALFLSGWLHIMLGEYEDSSTPWRGAAYMWKHMSLFAIIPGFAFATGFLLSKFGRTWTARTVSLVVFPLHTWVLIFTPVNRHSADLLMRMPRPLGSLIYGLSIAGCVALACATVLRIQRAAAGPAPSPPP